MTKPLLNPGVDDTVPFEDRITDYDVAHFITYARLLDAEKVGAAWQDAARIVLHRDPAADPESTHKCWEDHLTRAHWMTTKGYAYLLKMTSGHDEFAI
ncbi:MAG: DUF2285 domain-containing protein [Alphaproteobacteria bacterium]|nr:DUF2285 domain-containing protein [Alphaproteobacteria bacterium]